MKAAEYEICLNMQDGVAPHAMYVKQGDTVRKISVSLADGGNPYELQSDCSAVLCAELPNGETKRLAMDIYHNQLHATIPEEWVETAGEIRCEAQVIGANPSTRLTSPTFSIIVTEALSILEPENFAYWDKATSPMASASRKIPITDANFDCQITSDTNSYGWILIPKSLYPAAGVVVASTNGLYFSDQGEITLTAGGVQITYHAFKTTATFSTIHPYVFVKEKEEEES